MANRELILAVDVDDVLSLTAPALIKWSNDSFGCQLTIKDFCEDLPKMWSVDRQEAERRWLLIYEQLLPILEPTTTVADIRRVVPSGVKLLPLTSRRLEHEQLTNDWVQRHYPGLFLPAKSTNFPWKSDPNAHKLTKADAVKRHGAFGLVDDQPKHAVSVHDSGGLALCFGDYHWNKDLPDHIPRCVDWQSVGEVLHERLTQA